MSPVTSAVEGWIPVAFGALDVRGLSTVDPEAQVLLTPATPSDAICLTGEGAVVWRRIVQSVPVPASTLSARENAVLASLRANGLVVYARRHAAAVTRLDPPLLSSPLHELVYGVVAHVAQAKDIRCVFVKGPALHHQGLREREHSGDVDVWCDPARWDELAAELESWGWSREPDPWRGTSVHHSTTMTPISWGCEVDIHRRFPGLTLDDERAFEVMMSATDELRLASTAVAIPQRGMHAVLSALHTMRPAVGRVLTEADHRSARRTLRAASDAVDAARTLGAVPALRDDLTAVFPGVDLGDDRGTPRDWGYRARPDRVRAYAAALRSLPVREQLTALRNLLWPPDDVALASARRAGEPTRYAGRARYRRLIRGARYVVKAFRPKGRR